MLETRQARLPGVWPVIARQVGYQLRLLARNPRSIVISVLVPGVLVAINASHHGRLTQSQDSMLTTVVGGAAVFGILTMSHHARGLPGNGSPGRGTAALAGEPAADRGYFAGRITATALVAVTSAVIAVGTGTARAT